MEIGPCNLKFFHVNLNKIFLALISIKSSKKTINTPNPDHFSKIQKKKPI